MLTYERWKYFIILVVLLFSAIYASPNVFQKDPSVQITASRGATVDEGLQGRVVESLKKAGISSKAVEIEGDNLLVRLNTPDDQVRASDELRPVLGSDYVVALNLASNVPDWLSAIGAQPMLLGLDLQGGVHFLMQVDQKAALDKQLEASTEDVRILLRENRLRYESVTRSGENSIVVTLTSEADSQRARELLSINETSLAQQSQGATITLSIPDAELQRMALAAIEQNVGTLRNRINSLGVSEPIIQRQGDDRIVVQLPGVQDTAQAKRILGATATLEYRAVVEGNAYDAVASGSIPPQAKVYYRKELGPDGKPMPVLLNKRVIASGDQLVGATAMFDQQSGSPAVSVRLNSAGGQRMFDFTSENVGKPMAVVYIERIPEVRVVNGEEVRSTRISEEVISVANINGVFGK
ncbi:MAG: protein translocase subunit SecD, partial [Pseudomonadota bacterium]|nr:protein translocase subunit SecD [Pseudomonadota bacterium]